MDALSGRNPVKGSSVGMFRHCRKQRVDKDVRVQQSWIDVVVIKLLSSQLAENLAFPARQVSALAVSIGVGELLAECLHHDFDGAGHRLRQVRYVDILHGVTSETSCYFAVTGRCSRLLCYHFGATLHSRDSPGSQNNQRWATRGDGLRPHYLNLTNE